MRARNETIQENDSVHQEKKAQLFENELLGLETFFNWDVKPQRRA